MRARVKNGRWVLDDPADLPEGTEVEIVTRPIASGAKAANDVYLDDRLRTYIRALLVAVCSSKFASHAAHGPADEEALADAAKANARLANRKFTIPEDIKKAAPDALRRFVSEETARKVDLSPEDVIRRILDVTEVP